MQYKLFFVLMLVAIAANAQKTDTIAHLTSEHVLVKGTNISMVPPTGFVVSESFQGFKKPTDPTTMIMVTIIPGPFLEIVKGFDPEVMKARGLILKDKKVIQIDQYEGMIAEVTQAAAGLKYAKTILLYGDSSSTTMINGISLEDSIETGNKIRNCIYSTRINENLKVDPRAELDYTLDESAGGLQLLAVINNLMLFNRDGKKPTQSADKIVFLADKSYLKTLITDKKAFCIARLKQYPDDYALKEEPGVKEIKLDGLKGYELYAQNTEKLDEEMYQVALFREDGGYFLFVATYLKGSKKAIADAKAIIKTFKQK